MTKTVPQYQPLSQSCYNKWKYNPNPRSVLTTKLNLKRSIEIKLNRIRVDLASRADFYRHNFKEFTDPCCLCGYQQQTKSHLLLDCLLSNGAREVFTQNLKELPTFNYNNFATLTKASKIKIMLFEDCKLSDECNKEITNLSAYLIDKIISYFIQIHYRKDKVQPIFHLSLSFIPYISHK
ncbi:unnamed protein product, partial [Owenia fusiformis]